MSTQKTGTVTLVVDKFSQLTTYKQIVFTFVGNCLFGIHPQSDVLSWHPTDNVYVYWCGFNNVNAKVNLKVSILNANNDKLYTQEYNWDFDSSAEGNRPFVAFISRAKLLAPKNGYLLNDKLTLLCEAKTVDKESKNFDSIPQPGLENLSANFQSLLIDGKLSDVTLIVGSDGKKFQVHKAILAARSSVFAAMFEHDCEEKRLNEVKITDIDPETCDELLHCIYTGKVKQMDRYALDLLQAADKYQLDSLKNNCEQFLCSTLSTETAANALLVADLHGSTSLKDKCLEYISANINQVKDTDGWKVLKGNSDLLCELLFYMANKNK